MSNERYLSPLPSYDEVVGNLNKHPSPSAPPASVSSTPPAPSTSFDIPVIYHPSYESLAASQIQPTSSSALTDKQKSQSSASTEKSLAFATLLPHPNFNVKEDFVKLQIAIASKNKSQIIKILCNRSTEQRLKICNMYNENSGHNLQHDIKATFGSTSNFTKIMLGLAQPFDEYLARLIFQSGKDYYWFMETFFILSNDVCKNVRDSFKRSKYVL